MLPQLDNRSSQSGRARETHPVRAIPFTLEGVKPLLHHESTHFDNS